MLYNTKDYQKLSVWLHPNMASDTTGDNCYNIGYFLVISFDSNIRFSHKGQKCNSRIPSKTLAT